MNKKLSNIIKFLLFISIGGLLFYFVYRGSDFKAIFSKMSDIRWGWFGLAVVVMMLSHISRAIRWNLLLESTGDYKPRFLNTFFAVMNMYLVNMLLPRVGEVTRSGVVSRYDKIPLSKVLGTMITERAVDMLMLLIFALTAFIFQGSVIAQFLKENPETKNTLAFLFNPWFWVILVLIIVGGIVFLILLAKGKFDKIKFLSKIGKFVRSFVEGLLSIFKLKRPWAFIGHSIFIFVMYFTMLWLCFPAFSGIRDLSGMAALTIFVAGSLGMVAPAPNGVGAWHFMTIQTMLIYGVARGDAETFALVVHGIQMIMLIIIGGIATLGIPVINRKHL